jgi:hypothetical protein
MKIRPVQSRKAMTSNSWLHSLALLAIPCRRVQRYMTGIWIIVLLCMPSPFHLPWRFSLLAFSDIKHPE